MLRRKLPANYIGYEVVCKQALRGVLMAGGGGEEGEILTVSGI